MCDNVSHDGQLGLAALLELLCHLTQQPMRIYTRRLGTRGLDHTITAQIKEDRDEMSDASGRR